MFHRLKGKTIFISGASAGIGEAAARQFAAAGASVFLGSRRTDRLETLCKELLDSYHISASYSYLDVQSETGCQEFIDKGLAEFGHCDILINNAGLARGRDFAADLKEEDMREMFETNVYGLIRLTKMALKPMLHRGSGHIINLGSVAGYMSYAGGSVYCATKFGVRAFSESLRYELLGKNIRVSCVSPGLVETEFSVVRFKGDESKAKEVYKNMTPLTAEDIAECLTFVASRPAHVDIDDLIIRPTEQAGLTVHRNV
ncbi:MAG: SDR family NAD(P)-dependent oxidoreductase [Chloroherpetonaceae bacterium]|nr:SDR family NAD(P)-dependent oxidoreductase [Chloroherpetonaceae bacterium]